MSNNDAGKTGLDNIAGPTLPEEDLDLKKGSVDVTKQREPIASDPGDSLYHTNLFMTDAQFKSELERCEYCEEKPCKDGCPCDCSPTDFIRSSQIDNPSDIKRAAAQIMTLNPLGGICGQVCPDKHCMAKCVHKDFDNSIEIPMIQATIIEKAKKMGVMPELEPAESNGKKIAIIGGGPAGLAAAALLAQRGYEADILEKEDKPGGMCNIIPDFRLDKSVLRSDIEWTLNIDKVNLQIEQQVEDTEALLDDYDGVVVATGLWEPIFPGIENEELGIAGLDFLFDPESARLKDKNVAIIGGGATAFDCAMIAKQQNPAKVELFALENLSEMPLTNREMNELTNSNVDADGRIQVDAILSEDGASISGIATKKVKLNGEEFKLDAIEPIAGSESKRNDIDVVIFAIGSRPRFKKVDNPAIFYAGDCIEGPTTVVEASAAGKNVADKIDCFLNNEEIPEFSYNDNGCVKSRIEIPGYNYHPVSLETDFFGYKLEHPFLLSAAPPTDGYDQMTRAYEAGWAGGIMKTSFAEGPIHIPAQYMFKYSDDGTFANCDNVSGHLLDRVCGEIEQLVEEWPNKLTAASTGGPVTGNDESDCKQWQINTRRLEDAGAKLIEYSLSCPQGGEGTEGDIVAQSAELSAKIIDWVMQTSDPDIPKLFKLTGAVTAIESIVSAVKEVLDRYPNKKAGITLANTFPTLTFREKEDEAWEKGIVAGMSGQGALNISYLSLAKAAPLGVVISGNGGPMDYKAAADFLALGCQTVQFCTMPTALGYKIIDDLTEGVSHLMADRGISSMDELIGISLPDPMWDFMDLPDEKEISDQDRDLCVQCGNCTRCPYLAIEMDEDNYPETDAERCIGCAMCEKLCPVDAIELRERTAEEAELLSEE